MIQKYGTKSLMQRITNNIKILLADKPTKYISCGVRLENDDWKE